MKRGELWLFCSLAYTKCHWERATGKREDRAGEDEQDEDEVGCHAGRKVKGKGREE